MSQMLENASKPLTEEEQKIDAAMDRHIAALDDELLVMKGLGFCYLVGFPLLLFAPEDSGLERVGLAMVSVALLLIVVHFFVRMRSRKIGREAKVLVDAYLRKKALPFYNELTEMFADKPGVHIHLEEDGKITVSDRRKKEESNG